MIYRNNSSKKEKSYYKIGINIGYVFNFFIICSILGLVETKDYIPALFLTIYVILQTTFFILYKKMRTNEYNNKKVIFGALLISYIMFFIGIYTTPTDLPTNENYFNESSSINTSDDVETENDKINTETESTTTKVNETTTKKVSSQKTTKKIDTTKQSTTKQTTTKQATTSSNNNSVSTGKKNALRSAKNYLDVMAFSYTGLIKQLEFEKYSHEDAVYAADNCGANWNTQALKSAKNYLSTMAFSYTGLIKQLKFEGFTSEQAQYGVDNCGADWYEQASKSAKNYLDTMAFSRDSLISQLEFEGFTHEQAVYGAESNGY